MFSDPFARRQPADGTVLMSGYREEDARPSPGNGAIAGFLQKPFSGDELAIVLNRVLAGRGTDAASRA